VIHWTGRGTHKAAFLGMPPTNKQTTVSGTSIFRIEGGKIAEQWADWNLMSLMEQLGISTAPKVEGKVAA
jgi:predicted ester cyclase